MKHMNKYEKLAIGAAIILAVASILVQFIFRKAEPRSINIGSIFTEPHAYSTGATYVSTQLTNSLATLLISRATSSRTFCEVCQNSTSSAIVWLFKQGTSTGVAVNLGYPLYSSSTNFGLPCARYDADDPWTGQVWGIAGVTTTVTTSCVQN